MSKWLLLFTSIIFSYYISTSVCFAHSSTQNLSTQNLSTQSLPISTSQKPSINNKPLRIAVASNFAPVLAKILPDFIQQTHINAEIISGASGGLYQQIKYGAPFDVFLSADNIHPKRLKSESLIIKNSLATYAFGQLAFWSANEAFDPNQKLFEILSNYHDNSLKIAIANPNIAPYGQRAFEVLQSLNLWKAFSNKTITSINVNQTFQQIRSQSVTGGFIALSQLTLNNLHGKTISEKLYSPIEQQLVILKNTKHAKAAELFVNFLLDINTQKRLKSYGYKTVFNTTLLTHSKLVNNDD